MASCLVEEDLVRLLRLRIDQFDDETLRVLERRRLLVDDGDVDLADCDVAVEIVSEIFDGEGRAESFLRQDGSDHPAVVGGSRDDEIDWFDALGGSFHANGRRRAVDELRRVVVDADRISEIVAQQSFLFRLVIRTSHQLEFEAGILVVGHDAQDNERAWTDRGNVIMASSP